jgi:hypothetical protein
MAHECWILIDSDATSTEKRGHLDEIMSRALTRVEDLGARLPQHMLALFYMRSSQTGWMTVMLMLPDRGDVTGEASQRIQAWVRRYAGALHAGYDGKLPAAGLPVAVARDPT